MAVKPPTKGKTRTLAEMTGVEFYEDSAGRTWYIRVCCLGTAQRDFFEPLVAMLTPVANAKAQVKFLQRVLYDPQPGLWVFLRRRFGLPDYSFRYLENNIRSKDFNALFDAIIRANQDISSEEFFAKIKEMADSKKKMNVTPISDHSIAI